MIYCIHFNNKVANSKMKKICIRLLLITSISISYCTLTNAQLINTKIQTDSISLNLFHGKYVKNGKKYNIGFLSKNLKKEMIISPNAIIEFKKYERHRNRAMLLSVIGAGMVWGAIFSHDNNSIVKQDAAPI